MQTTEVLSAVLALTASVKSISKILLVMNLKLKPYNFLRQNLSRGMAATNGVPKALKILMLHGYTQSGPLFHAKTKALEKILIKAFPGITLTYPTGPMKLKASDVPGFDMSKVEDEREEVESYGWWRRSNTSDPPEYVGIEEGFQVVADTMKTHGPFDGVLGFSQGAAMATMVSSLLEGDSRKEAFRSAQAKSKLAIPYSTAFANLNHPPLKFCISYAGFVAPGERYTAFYEPVLRTPMCHFIGSLDTVVEEARTDRLVDAAGGPSETIRIVHPGGHFVPNNRQYIDAAVAFIRAKITEIDGGSKKEETVEDMDVPF